MNSTLFTDAMALTPAGDGVYDGNLNKHWTIGPKVHGGAMLALCANAARTACGGTSAALEPVAVSASFLWAPDPGGMRLGTSIPKHGLRVTVAHAELAQGAPTPRPP